MNSQPHPEDGPLQPALRALSDAIAALTDPRPEHFVGKTYWLDSHYQELKDALPGDQGNGHGVARSLPPLFVDAADLLHKIDVKTAEWEPRPIIDGDEHITVIRLRSIEKYGCRGIGWRPQDATKAEQIAGDIQAWVKAIKKLLNPPREWTLPNPCPACQTAVVYRKDAAGETVRRPALTIGSDGCTCLQCHATWSPSYFTHLARVLGYELPSGVLE